MSANVAARTFAPDFFADLRDAMLDLGVWLQARMNRPLPRAAMEPMVQPERAPQPASTGLRRHGRWIVPGPSGCGGWLAPWLLTVTEVMWNMPKYTLTLLGAGALMVGAHWLSGWSMVFAVLMAVCAYGAWHCCVALAQADWHAVWRDLRRGLRHLHRRSARPARRLRLGSKSVPVGRRGWAA